MCISVINISRSVHTECRVHFYQSIFNSFETWGIILVVTRNINKRSSPVDDAVDDAPSSEFNMSEPQVSVDGSRHSHISIRVDSRRVCPVTDLDK